MLNDSKKILLSTIEDNAKFIYLHKASAIKQKFTPSPDDIRRRRFFPKTVIIFIYYRRHTTTQEVRIRGR